MRIVGVDTGGTFTDFALIDEGRLSLHKEPSTPDQPEQAIILGFHALGLDVSSFQVVHGSTVATNAVLEGKTAKTLFITNRGFGDLMAIGRQARDELYNLTPKYCKPLIDKALVLETGGRISALGEVLDPLTVRDLEVIGEAIDALKPDSVAINLLFSFIEPRFERMISESISSKIFVSCSHEVLPEYREYERGLATWVNACTGPVMKAYLNRLQRFLINAPLSIMQSSGVTCSTEFATTHPVNLLLSGPAAGLIGAANVANAAGYPCVITFDMGGTSTDVSVVDGEITLTSEGVIGPYPVGVPMVDLETIGAGGGSLVWVDEGGLLHVGPQSAGALPGPVCYGRGGTQITVTDANVWLGRLPAGIKLGGHIELNLEATKAAFSILTSELGETDVEKVALGVIDVVNENMLQALKEISLERGIDPRDFVMLAFGGSGGLHCCVLAEALGMRKILIPKCSGVLSAIGMAVAIPGRRYSRAIGLLEDECDEKELNRAVTEMYLLGQEQLLQEGYSKSELFSAVSADIRYCGQSSTLNLPWSPAKATYRAFELLHEKRFGHKLDRAVELVNLRVSVDSKKAIPDFELDHDPQESTSCADVPISVLAWHNLSLAGRKPGPLVILDKGATVYVAQGWSVGLDNNANLLLEYCLN
jgi:N-methylhydantoinase A